MGQQMVDVSFCNIIFSRSRISPQENVSLASELSAFFTDFIISAAAKKKPDKHNAVY